MVQPGGGGGGGSPGSQVDKTERRFKSSPSSITDGGRQLPPHPSISVLHGEPGCRMLRQKPMHSCRVSHTHRGECLPLPKHPAQSCQPPPLPSLQRKLPRLQAPPPEGNCCFCFLCWPRLRSLDELILIKALIELGGSGGGRAGLLGRVAGL